MKLSTKITTVSLAIGISLINSISAGEVQTNNSSHGDRISVEHPHDLLRSDFKRGWLEPVPKHSHGGDSRYIHPLTVEAAFNDNDFFVDYAFNSFDDEDEHEIELELELALTRRLGLVIETAYEFENEDGDTEEGFGDLEVAARFVLLEYDRFIATANIGLGIPIGDDDFTSDELIVEPSLLTWFDFGKGFTLNTVIGAEFATESGEAEFVFDAALVKDLAGPVALTLESRNEVSLSGEERGDITSEATLGLIYRLNDATSIRSGWSFPIDNDEFQGGAIVSFNYSF